MVPVQQRGLSRPHSASTHTFASAALYRTVRSPLDEMCSLDKMCGPHCRKTFPRMGVTLPALRPAPPPPRCRTSSPEEETPSPQPSSNGRKRLPDRRPNREGAVKPNTPTRRNTNKSTPYLPTGASSKYKELKTPRTAEKSGHGHDHAVPGDGFDNAQVTGANPARKRRAVDDFDNSFEEEESVKRRHRPTQTTSMVFEAASVFAESAAGASNPSVGEASLDASADGPSVGEDGGLDETSSS
ncbi:hypothetical protein QBC39DRAFT_25281 [Podospora conica]|nr:hypothetical protein QBC39DRAFT_25281 [Schizothecium conicum]